MQLRRMDSHLNAALEMFESLLTFKIPHSTVTNGPVVKLPTSLFTLGTGNSRSMAFTDTFFFFFFFCILVST